MFRAGIQLKKALIIVHRWMGVSLCLLFLSWFASGIVLMYWDYPAVSEADRLSRAAVLDAAGVRLSPQEAYARLQTDLQPDQVKLGTLDGRPVYRFRFGEAESIVSAVNGQTQTEFPPELTLRIASSWTGQPPAEARVEENTEEDQWTVSGEFQDLRPMRKYSWPDGEQVYVSTVTGEVAQYTTRASRMGAYFGAIPHWLYFTPLRKHASMWARIVIWASGLGTVAALFGIIIGALAYSPSKRFLHKGAPSSLPYTGQKRWHSILGLIFGLLACSWAFSGMLSMDPFPRLQGETWDNTGARLAEALRGGSIQLADFTVGPQVALARLGSDFRAKELEFGSFAGEPVYLATGERNQNRIVPVRGEVAAVFDRNKIIDVIGKAARPYTLVEVRLVTQYEAYYLDRHHRHPLPVIFVKLSDAEHSTFYIDLKTARIVQSYNSHARWNRWLYHGLHSMDLPWLYSHRPIWDIIVLILLIGGTALCITSLLLAWRVLRRTFGQDFPGPS
jgi:hypothetical protein